MTPLSIIKLEEMVHKLSQFLQLHITFQLFPSFMNNKRLIIWVWNSVFNRLKDNPWILYIAQEFPSPSPPETLNIMVNYQLSKSQKFHLKIFQAYDQSIRKITHIHLRRNKKVRRSKSSSVKRHTQITTIWTCYQVNCHLPVMYTRIWLLIIIPS